MSDDKLCRDCVSYTLLGKEDSGLEGWEYGIGRCDNPDSVHSGRNNLADWNSCWLFKRKRGKSKNNEK